jgi:hypothetical protein
MIKKITLAIVFVLFSGVLVAGALNRTGDKLEQTANPQPARAETEFLEGQGHAAERQAANAQEPRAQGAAEDHAAQAAARRAANAAQAAARQAGRTAESYGQNGRVEESHGQSGDAQPGFGRAEAPGNPDRQTAANVSHADLVTYDGVVVQPPAPGADLLIRTADGEVSVGTGPDYLAQQGFTLAAGETIAVQGFWENDEFKAVAITRLADGVTIALRETTGRPLWAGSGRAAEDRGVTGQGLRGQGRGAGGG